MYVYEDIPMLIETIKKQDGEHINLLIDGDILDTNIIFLKLFIAHHQIECDLKAVFRTIDFLRTKHGYDRSKDDLYNTIGVVLERMYMEDIDTVGILEGYLSMYLNRAYMSILNKEEVTIRDILSLYDITPVPIQSNDDIKKRTLES